MHGISVFLPSAAYLEVIDTDYIYRNPWQILLGLCVLKQRQSRLDLRLKIMIKSCRVFFANPSSISFKLSHTVEYLFARAHCRRTQSCSFYDQPSWFVHSIKCNFHFLSLVLCFCLARSSCCFHHLSFSLFASFRLFWCISISISPHVFILLFFLFLSFCIYVFHSE